MTKYAEGIERYGNSYLYFVFKQNGDKYSFLWHRVEEKEMLEIAKKRSLKIPK